MNAPAAKMARDKGDDPLLLVILIRRCSNRYQKAGAQEGSRPARNTPQNGGERLARLASWDRLRRLLNLCDKQSTGRRNPTLNPNLIPGTKSSSRFSVCFAKLTCVGYRLLGSPRAPEQRVRQGRVAPARR